MCTTVLNSENSKHVVGRIISVFITRDVESVIISIVEKRLGSSFSFIQLTPEKYHFYDIKLNDKPVTVH